MKNRLIIHLMNDEIITQEWSNYSKKELEDTMCIKFLDDKNITNIFLTDVNKRTIFLPKHAIAYFYVDTSDN